MEDLQTSMQTNDKVEAEHWTMDPHRLVDTLLNSWWMLRGIEIAAAKIVPACTEVTHQCRNDMTRPGHRGEALQRFNEHVCRASGAQMLTRLGLPLETVQLIGRWGSDAIKVYVQETPLHHGNSLFSGPDIDKPRQVREMVKHCLETLRNKFWIVNTAIAVVHLPGSPEINMESTRWRTICAWSYRSAPHVRHLTRPDGKQCKRCFRASELQRETNAITDGEDAE